MGIATSFTRILLIPFVLLYLMSTSAWGALSTNITWEVHNGGVDTNGGCFLPGATGTDRSLSDSPFTSFTDLIVGGTTTDVTSVAFPFSATDVGNCIKIASGSGCTVGYFQVISVATVTATLDRSAGTAASTCVAKLGGAIKTLSQLNTAMGTSNVVQHAYVKADATYSISSGVTFNFAQSSNLGADITGYSSTRPSITTPGDEVKPTISSSAGSFTMITLGNNNSAFNVTFQNFILDGNAQTSMTCASSANNADLFRNIWAKSCGTGFTETGFNFYCERCIATGMITNNGKGFSWTSGGICIDCYAGDSSATGIAGFATTRGQCIRCVAANLSGGTNSVGFSIGTLSFQGMTIDSSICYAVTRSCFEITQAGNTSFHAVTIKNSIAASVGSSGFCFDNTSGTSPTIYYGMLYNDYNACWPNAGTAYSDWTAGTHNVLLTGDPFTNGATFDFSLNNTAGAGAAARAVGFPGTYTRGGTGYKDIGTFQHADPVSTPATIVTGHAQ